MTTNQNTSKKIRQTQIKAKRNVREIVTFIMGKLFSSILVASLVFLVFAFVVKTAQGEKTGSVITFLIENWVTCLFFGLFITFFRIFESNFWK
jgi:uncharacterized membrane protein